MSLAGETFGKYRLIGIISTGGMGELYLALQAGLEGFTRVVALKRMLPHLESSEDFVRMFLDEARLAARLDHQNIIRIYELGEFGGRYFTAMEYLPGEDLAKVLEAISEQKAEVPSDIAATLMQAAADGLHFAHELTDAEGTSLKLVHRDVSPQNIVVTYYGGVKVVDFGIAKAADNLSATRAGTFKGKLGYVSPEQLNDAGSIDRRSDIFCLGIIMWELLAGRRLFARKNEMDTIMAIREGKVPPLEEIRPDIDPMLPPIVMKALAQDPNERHQTAEQLRVDLESYLSSRPWRPTTRELADWLEKVFGSERALAKQAIARGTNLRSAISQVMKTLPPLRTRATVTLEKTGAPSSIADTWAAPVGKPQPSGWKRLVRSLPFWAALASVGAVVGVYVMWNSPEVEAAAVAGAEDETPVATATLKIDSEPPGASIFLHGEPTGRVTPASISGLTPGKPIDIRLEKSGYASVTDSVLFQPGETVERRPKLVASVGHVRLVGLPRDASLQIDGEPVPAKDSLDVPRGRHEFRILWGKGKVVVHTVEVRDGTVTLKVR
jgi:serine/threonine-protein kinase